MTGTPITDAPRRRIWYNTAMKSKRSSQAVERILRATDPASVPGDLSAEEKIKWLEAQNHLLRFHYTALVEHASGFSPEEFAKIIP